MVRADFYELLSQINLHPGELDLRMNQNHAGSRYGYLIPLGVKLCITLRLFAFLTWYGMEHLSATCLKYSIKLVNKFFLLKKTVLSYNFS